MPGRIILLAYYFPPLIGAASERASALAKALPSLGWEPVVIAPRDGFYHRTSEPEPDCDVVRTSSLELSRMLRAGYSSVVRDAGLDSGTSVHAVRTDRLGSWLRGAVREFVYVPDAQVGWIPFAVKAAVQALRQAGDRSLIWSTSGPYSAHLAAMRAAHRLGRRWVAEFRDPWSTAHPINLPRHAMRRRLDLALERRILRTADQVIIPTETMRHELLAAHSGLGPDRLTVVTNGFVQIPRRAVPDPSSPLTILYAGKVEPGEEVGPLLAALDRLQAEHPGGVLLRVLGDSAPWNEEKWASAPWLKLDGFVSPVRAREAMAESSVLLLFQRHPANRPALQGKMFEYVGARRPILALCPENIEAARLLRRHADARIVSGDPVEGTLSELRRLLREHRSGTIQAPRVTLDVTQPLRREEQAVKLAQIFDRTLAEPALNRSAPTHHRGGPGD